MPDALAKTVPIWCAVMNQLLFGAGEVTVPEHVVGDSERAQLQERLAGWVEDVKVRPYNPSPSTMSVFAESIADRNRPSISIFPVYELPFRDP